MRCETPRDARSVPIVVATLLVLAASIGGAAAPTDATPTTCPDPEHVPRLGPACRTGDLWEVVLADGTTVRTHGHDPAGGTGGSTEVLAPDTNPDPPACTLDPSEYHNLMIYAHPQDVESRYDDIADDLRRAVAEVNGVLREEARQEGHVLEYRFLCSADEIVVDEVELPHDNEKAAFWRVVSDLKDQGYDDTNAKYWIFYDDRAQIVSWGGTATLHHDDRPTADNRNNRGPDWAVTWGELATSTMMHESAHNLGAVQPSAPHYYDNVGGSHCYDEADIMCYGAQASRQRGSNTFCVDRVRFDCGKDDYFDPSPEPGEYLDDHWNIGSPLNVFLEHRSCSPYQKAGDEIGQEIHRGAAPVAAVYSCGDPVAASPDGDAEGHRAAVSGSGDASGLVAVSLTGDAHGTVAVSATGESHGSLVAASGTGRAAGAVAASGTNRSETSTETCVSETVCTYGGVAASGTGDADGPVAASGDGDASGNYAAVSGTGNASGIYAAVSATGDATTRPPCDGVYLYCPNGPAVSGTGDAEGRIAVSLLGRANGSSAELSGCEAGETYGGSSALCWPLDG